MSEERQREAIREAARATGDPWLQYMGTHAEPAMTPAAWRTACAIAITCAGRAE